MVVNHPPHVTNGLKSVTKWIQQALFAIGACLLVVLFTATRISAPGSITPWPIALRTAAVQWIVWLVALVVIVQLDKSFPKSKEVLMTRLLLHVPSSLVISVFTTYLSAIAVQFALAGGGPYLSLPAILRQSWQNAFYTHVMIYWAIVGIYIAYEYHRRLLEREIRNARLEKLVSEAQLQALRSQLHPHFLFNSLNSISAYLERSPRQARKMLEQLGVLLRMSLEHSNDQEIPLSQEITFIRYYLELQQVRFEGRLEIKLETQRELMESLVPTFILQPIVENSIRYAVSSRSEKSLLEVRAVKREDRLVLTVQDDGPGLPPGWDLNLHAGVGLSNTRERLRCLYEDTQTFELSNGPGGRGVLATLSFPFRPAQSMKPGSLHDQYSRVGS